MVCLCFAAGRLVEGTVRSLKCFEIDVSEVQYSVCQFDTHYNHESQKEDHKCQNLT